MTPETIINVQDVKKLMYIPFALIITSFIIIGITISMTNQNALSALLGGYSGLFIGLLFIMIIKLLFLNAKYIDMIPIIMTMIVVGLLLFLVSYYFDRIISGNISSYYSTYSYLLSAFLFVQVGLIFIDINKTKLNLSVQLVSFFPLFYLMNIVCVLILAIVLNKYSTQG
jgi:hypothetical protein